MLAGGAASADCGKQQTAAYEVAHYAQKRDRAVISSRTTA